MRKIIGRAFSESNTMTPEELQQVVEECEKIPMNELSFEEKLGFNLACERLESIDRSKIENKEKDKMVELEERLAALEAEKSKE